MKSIKVISLNKNNIEEWMKERRSIKWMSVKLNICPETLRLYIINTYNIKYRGIPERVLNKLNKLNKLKGNLLPVKPLKYIKWYNNIINSRKSNPSSEYTESHHIVPKCCGGTDSDENLVSLTGREHYICHMLLTRIYQGCCEHYKLVYAFQMMCQCKGKYRLNKNGAMYEYNKKVFAKYKSHRQSEINKERMWIYNSTTFERKKIYKTECIPHGWKKGGKRCLLSNSEKGYKERRILGGERKRLRKANIIGKYTKMFILFHNGKYNSISEFIRTGSYNISVVSLSVMWRKYIKEFKPTPGRCYKSDIDIIKNINT